MSWGISENASPKEKMKSQMADYLKGLNSTGAIDYATYSEMFDFSMELLDKMHYLGKTEMDYIEHTPHKYKYFKND